MSDGGSVMSVCCIVRGVEGQSAVLSRRWRVSDVSVLCCQGDGGSVMSVCCVVKEMEGQCCQGCKVSVLRCWGGGRSVMSAVLSGGWKVSDVSVLCCQGAR